MKTVHFLLSNGTTQTTVDNISKALDKLNYSEIISLNVFKVENKPEYLLNIDVDDNTEDDILLTIGYTIGIHVVEGVLEKISTDVKISEVLSKLN